MFRSHALLGKAGSALPLQEHPVDQKWYHIEVPVDVPSASTQCLGLLRVLEPSRCDTPLMMSPWWPSLRKQQSRMSLGAYTPHVHLPTQKQVLGSFYSDDAVKASTCLHETRLACGSGSFSLGTYDAPTSYNLSKFIDIRPLLRDAHFCLRGQRVANH